LWNSHIPAAKAMFTRCLKSQHTLTASQIHLPIAPSARPTRMNKFSPTTSQSAISSGTRTRSLSPSPMSLHQRSQTCRIPTPQYSLKGESIIVYYAKVFAIILSSVGLSSSAFCSPIGMFDRRSPSFVWLDKPFDQSEAPIQLPEVHSPSVHLTGRPLSCQTHARLGRDLEVSQ